MKNKNGLEVIEISKETLIISVVVLLAIVGFSFWIFLDHKLWNDEYMVQIELEGKQFNYHFPSAVPERLQSVGSTKLTCKNIEQPVDIYLYKSGNIIRHLTYCPSEVSQNQIK